MGGRGGARLPRGGAARLLRRGCHRLGYRARAGRDAVFRDFFWRGRRDACKVGKYGVLAAQVSGSFHPAVIERYGTCCEALWGFLCTTAGDVRAPRIEAHLWVRYEELHGFVEHLCEMHFPRMRYSMILILYRAGLARGAHVAVHSW